MLTFNEFFEFKRLLLMGGNVEFGNFSAERIDLKKFSRDKLLPLLRKSLSSISSEFQKDSGDVLWSKELLSQGEFLSGSAFHFFDLGNIKTEDFVKVKPSIGDIDTQVDKTKGDSLESFLEKNIGKEGVFYKLTLKGFKKTPGQIISLWSFGSKNPFNIQIDFELVDFFEEKPSAWSNFSHSSPWEDMVSGIKGVFHKLLLRALTNKNKEKFVQVMKTKEKIVEGNILSFSVANGLRRKFVPVINKEGSHEKDSEGKLLKYKEVAVKDSTYEKSLNKIFSLLFDKKEPSPNDMKKFSSFKGLLSLLKTYLNEDQIDNVIDNFSNLLFDEKSQGLYKDDKERDKEEKMKAFSLLLKTFGKSQEPFQEKINEFYRKYK